MARINAALRAMQDSEDNQRRFAEADLSFHVAVSAASRNPLFRSFTGAVDIALSGYLSVTTARAMRDKKTVSASTARHAKVAKAIEARNEAAAIRAMLDVIDAGRNHTTGRPGRG
jgi:DNA-binding FadR family transcriptional regulator